MNIEYPVSRPVLIAYYLPQYYEMDINNRIYGKGYTEWTLASRAKPLFRGHYQPHLPADLGFYNLLMPESRAAQATMAQQYGIDAFCYWHYWFGRGKRLMEKPFSAVLESGQPDFPFCLSWANHAWHNPATGELICSMDELGQADHEAHFYDVLPAFQDPRYLRIDGKPLFSIFEPESLGGLDEFVVCWNDLAQENGLPGIYFVGIVQDPGNVHRFLDTRMDAVNVVRLKDFLACRSPWREYLKYKFRRFHDYPYREAARCFIGPEDTDERVFPTIITGWDHSPRSGEKSLILTGYTPDAFETHLRQVFDVLSKKQNRICFVKSWNEWGEGNYLEPDLKWGTAFLERLLAVKNTYADISNHTGSR